MTDASFDLGSASARVLIDVSGIKSGMDQAKKDFSSGLKGFTDGIKNVGANISGFGKDITVLAAPIAGIFAAAVKAASDSEAELAQLNSVLTSTKGVAGVTYDAAVKLASGLQKVTRYSDEQVLSGENLLLTFTNIGKDVFPDATKTMLDMSTALGQDLKSSAIQLGKALQDPVKGITALKRVGVNFTDAQKQMIEKMVAAGDTMGAQKLILKELQTEFGGSAVAAGKTFAGQLDILKNQFHDLLEKIGGAIIPVLQKLMTAVQPLVQAIGEWIDKNPDLVGGILIIGAALAVLGPILIAAGAAIGAIGGLLAFVLSPIGLLIGGVAALAVAFATNFGGIRDAVMPILTALEPVFNVVKDAVGTFLNAVSHGQDVFSAFQTAFGQLISNLGPAISEAVPKLIAAFGDLLSSIWQAIVDAVPKALKAFEDILGSIGDWLGGSGPGQLANGLGDLIAGIVNWITTNGPDLLKQAFIALMVGLNEFFNSDGWHRFSAGVQAMFQHFSDWISTSAWPTISGAISSITQSISDWFTGGGAAQAVAGIGNAFISLFNWVKDHGWETLTGAFKSVVESVAKFFSGTGAEQFIKGIGDAFISVFNWIVTTGLPMIGRAFQQIIDYVVKLFGQIATGIVDAVSKGVNDAVNAVKNIDTADVIQFITGKNIRAPGHADGTPLNEGWNMINEEGPEALYKQGSNVSVMTAGQTSNMLSGMLNGQGKGDGGDTYEIGNITIHANSYSEGQQAANGFRERLETLRRREG
jgi:hypothetical protein